MRENDLIFNTYLVLTAGLVDASWYIILTFLVTSKATLELVKRKSIILQNAVGSIFILIGILLLVQILIEYT